MRDRFPDSIIVADMKIADTGTLEVEMAAKAGANIVCVLADADDAVIEEAVRAARLYGIRLMADLINVKDPVSRACQLETMGIDIICAHVGIDQQMIGKNSLELLTTSVRYRFIFLSQLPEELMRRVPEMRCDTGQILSLWEDGLSVRQMLPDQQKRSVQQWIIPRYKSIEKKSPDEEIRSLLMQVSAPNITDAMHRKGAMTGIFSICGNVKMVGRAVTVQTFAGDWAKPVEAIDVARKDDVIVINNDGGTHVAPWGELATLSCVKKGISGVVIDGAVRDVDDIRAMKFPLFAKAIVPNAGEPKGFGEINAEIQCAGQYVRPGDWIIGDESGVVVIPAERAYEIARRALEVRKNEERIREEIRRGSTLSEVAELIKWEKK